MKATDRPANQCPGDATRAGRQHAALMHCLRCMPLFADHGYFASPPLSYNNNEGVLYPRLDAPVTPSPIASNAIVYTFRLSLDSSCQHTLYHMSVSAPQLLVAESVSMRAHAVTSWHCGYCLHLVRAEWLFRTDYRAAPTGVNRSSEVALPQHTLQVLELLRFERLQSQSALHQLSHTSCKNIP